MTNNPLFRDVKVSIKNMMNISEIIQVADDPINVVNNLDTIPATALAGRYAKVNENTAILRGSFHQGDRMFDSNSVATIVCIAFHLLDP